MNNKPDCIYYDDCDKEQLGWCACRRSGFFCEKAKDDMCGCCRLWDAYIPKTATQAEIEKAQKWDNMSLKEQVANPYNEYFGF